MKLASTDACTGCMACVDICPRNVLGLEIDRYGYFKVAVQNISNCIDCGLCTKVCPVLNIPKNENISSHPYAAWDEFKPRRKRSASGGVFAAIATIFLENNCIVYGASIDGFEIIHKRITDINDLHYLQGSKYQHSNMTGVYRLVKKDLSDGRIVLFSGLSCQIAGLYSFLGSRRHSNNLYTIDTVCGGVSTMLPMLNLKSTGLFQGINSFRDKENGWQSVGFKYSLKMVRTDGNIEDFGLNNIVLDTFSSKLYKRASCLNCQFTGFHRLSDCTIADFWGDKRYVDQHHDGVSVMILHNTRLISFIEKSRLVYDPIKWSDFIQNNPNVYWSHQPYIKFFPSRKKGLEALRIKQNEIAKKQINIHSIPGLFLRLYLKINGLHRFFSYYIKIKCLDKNEKC